MKYYIFITLAVLLVLLTGFSIYLYCSWDKTRYDETIITAAERYNLSPALLKALAYYKSPRKDVVGILEVPQEAIVLYQESMMTRQYQFVCRHRNKRPHKKELFEKREPCPICGTPYIEEFLHPDFNIEIGAWYLAYLRKEIENSFGIQAQVSLELTLYGYLFGIPQLRERTANFSQMFESDLMKAEMHPILKKWQKFQKDFSE